ncbi:MAG: NFACT family protein [Clostridia bacterium]|nr:NFACT family protein [Clostridia bacterium]
MAFDACMMRAVLSEFSREFPEAKIEKVLQPQNDEIDLVVHHGRSSRRLVLNVGPNAPRLQLSDIAKENPLKAPMFCMLLRKHFLGARIVGVEQLGFDRIAVFKVSCYDEMGFQVEKKIICEIMGKYANLIITDSEWKILAAMKIIDFAASTVRQVLPGMRYQIPAMQDKLSPLVIDKDAFSARLASFPKERSVEKFITSTYSGIATQIAHEICYRTSGQCDLPLMNVDPDRLYKVFSEWQELLILETYTPTVAVDRTGRPIDYSYMDITYLGDGVTVKHFDSLSALFDAYFAEKDRLEKIHQRGHDLVTLLNNAVARTERKLAIQRESLLESEKGEEYRKKGDLIIANIYQLKRGMTSFSAIDYYDNECPEVTIELDSRLSPADNAQRYYKLYNKAKTAKEVLTKQIAIWENELIYLESVKTFLAKAETEEDLVEIRDELYRSGYAAKLRGYKPPKQIKARPMRFRTSGGYELLVGRNNMQNDHLTFKMAEKHDIWFHTKDIPGSHVIMVTGGDEPSERDYTEAAGIAAYYSKATADMVAVDYTAVKNIKKPQGAKPGFVIYKTNYTAFVRPISGEELQKNGNG